MLVLSMIFSTIGSSMSGVPVVSAAEAAVEKNVADANLLSRVQNAEVIPENLGIPGEERYGTKYYAKNIWDMAAVDGKVFLSMGDYGTNTGAVPIYYYKNDSTTKYESGYESNITTAGLSSEEIKRFYEIDGEIYATATDPLGGADGSYYKYNRETDKWIDYYKLPNCVHCFDMVEYDGEIFFAGMVSDGRSNSNIISCVQKISKDKLCSVTAASNVDFYYADGTKFQAENVNYEYNGTASSMFVSEYWRSYDMFVYKGELYAAHTLNSIAPNTKRSGLFKYDKENNRFVQVYEGKAIKGFLSVTRNISSFGYVYQDGMTVEGSIHYSFEDNSSIPSALTVGQEEIYGEPICGAKLATENTFIAVCNGIFRSVDAVTFEKVSLGKEYENYVTRDAFEKDGKYYFLASQKNGTDNFTTAVFETDDDFTNFRKVLSFDTPSFARSFVYNEGYLYVGLGSNGRANSVGSSDISKYSGTLYRVNLSELISDEETETGKEEESSEAETGKEEGSSEVETGKEEGSSEVETGKEEGSSEAETGKEEGSSEAETGKKEEPPVVENKNEAGVNSENLQQKEDIGSKIKVGDIVDGTNAQYKVLMVDANGGTVEYIATKNKKGKTIQIPATITIDHATYKVTSIADNAVKNHKNVRKVVIGSNVKTIGKYAFKNCKKLSSVTIGSNVTKIGKEAFRGCSQLKKITIKSKKLKTVGKNGFKGVKANAKIIVPSSKKRAYKKLLKLSKIK